MTTLLQVMAAGEGMFECLYSSARATLCGQAFAARQGEQAVLSSPRIADVFRPEFKRY